jgi:hypothetical protein
MSKETMEGGAKMNTAAGIVVGEYTNVALAMARHDPEAHRLLQHAHGQSISTEDAAALVDLLVEHYRLAPIKVVFRKGSRGRYFFGERRMILPRVPIAPGESWCGRLRLGIVLHELAHAVVGAGKAPHGARFVEAFAGVLRTAAPFVKVL